MTELLMTPGPTLVPLEVLKAMAQPVIHHRTPEFIELFNETTERLKRVFKTQNDTFIIAGSGTACMEAAICNTIQKGDKVLSLVSGKFSERLSEIAKTYGAEVTIIEADWGTAIDTELVKKALTSDTKLLTMVFNETSTGVRNNIQPISNLVKGTDTLLLVDAISGLAGDEFETDKWGVDLCISGSQKCFAAATSLGFITVSQKAWNIIENNPTPRYYLDLRKYKGAKPTPFSTPVTSIYGLKTALDLIAAEKLENRIKRHAEIAKLCRDGVKKLGFELFPESEEICSNTLTAVKSEKAAEIIKKLLEKHNIRIAGAQAHMKGKMFRIGHMGAITKEHVEKTLAALEDILQ
jgi:aspartate aminotransferase-like enzyme